MSYILQALAQSERERRHADAPDLTHVFDVEAPVKKGPRRKTLIFGVLLLLINVVAIAALILVGDFQFGSKANTSTTTVADIAPKSAPIPESIPAPQQEVALIKEPPQPINPAPSAPQASIPIDETPAKDTATQQKSLEDQATEYIKNIATQEIPIKDTPVVKLPVKKPKPVVDELAKAVKQQHDKIVGTTGLERVRTLPGIDLSVHVYSEKTAERFVFINGQEYREGDTLTTDGALLEAITPDGIIVDLGDQRVLLSRIR